MYSRIYQPSDEKEVREMLSAEGIAENEQFIGPESFIFEEKKQTIGYFALRRVHNTIQVQHYILKRGFRGAKRMRESGKIVMATIRSLGFKSMIFGIKKDYMNKIAKFYFKKEPYAVKDGYQWYLTEV